MTLKSSFLVSAALVSAVGALTAGPAVADVVFTTPVALVPVTPGDPFVNPSGNFSAFDISFADPVLGDIFIADRSNAGVDIFSGSGLTQIGRALGFAGVQPPPPAAPNNSISGPDGVLTVTSGTLTTLYAGDGNSTLKVFQFTNPTNPGSAAVVINTGGTTRVDEMAFSPLTGQVLAANNAETPAFGNLFSTANGHLPVSLTTTPGVGIQVPASQGGIAAGGMEQPAWNPLTTGGPRSGFLSRSWALAGPLTQVGSPRSALMAQCCKPRLSQTYRRAASHRGGARRPDSPLPGTATC